MRGVLLDVDGTLLDSNDAHARSWAEALEGSGASLPYEQLRKRIGKGGDKLLWEVMGIQEHSPEGKHVSQLKKEIFHARYLGALVPFPGVRELIERMRGEGLRLIVATSSAKDELQKLLDAALVSDLLEDRVSKDDVQGRSKPDPDIIELAIERIGLPPADLVMLGDTPYDVEAASRAHVATIALRCGGWSEESLAGAAAVYRDPADLLLHYDTSPLARI
jgi:HAD superfamily hydrolase (TIGR01509 family)